LPRGFDVNHLDRIRHHNWAMNLELQPELANRSRREMTADEAAVVAEFMNA
jgi:hypothetical protein